jgi:hypothetical protein
MTTQTSSRQATTTHVVLKGAFDSILGAEHDTDQDNAT